MEKQDCDIQERNLAGNACLDEGSANFREWEYARKGDYYRNLNPNWSYTPTYLRKMQHVRRFLSGLSKEARILDAGCGEGVLVEEFSQKGYRIEGIDLNYASKYVTQGNILDLTNLYEDEHFDAVLLLDVFEHLAFADQPVALKEIKRVLRWGGISWFPFLIWLTGIRGFSLHFTAIWTEPISSSIMWAKDRSRKI